MRKRLVVATITAVMLLALLSSIAYARFSSEAVTTISGTTGTVSIHTWNVTLTDKFQPGDTQYAWLRVYNNGTCPVKITWTRFGTLPTWLRASLTEESPGKTFYPGNSVYFKLYVHMPERMTRPQGASFSFRIRFHAENISTNWGTIPRP